MPARIALTFDYYPCFCTVPSGQQSIKDLMYAAGGLIGTFYVWHPNIIASGTPTGNQVLLSDLVLAKMLGHEIGAYTQDNMVSKLSNNRNDANNFLRDLDSGMNAAGFKAATIAPNQRSWSQTLANMARGRFKGVRVAANYAAPLNYPVNDPLYVNDGGANSWGSDATANAGSNTPSAILARADAQIAAGGTTRIEVIHKIGNAAAVAADPVYTFLDTSFSTVLSGYASRIAAGDLQLITMEQALTA